jgi:hypothetical protein
MFILLNSAFQIHLEKIKWPGNDLNQLSACRVNYVLEYCFNGFFMTGDENGGKLKFEC